MYLGFLKICVAYWLMGKKQDYGPETTEILFYGIYVVPWKI